MRKIAVAQQWCKLAFKEQVLFLKSEQGVLIQVDYIYIQRFNEKCWRTNTTMWNQCIPYRCAGLWWILCTQKRGASRGALINNLHGLLYNIGYLNIILYLNCLVLSHTGISSDFFAYTLVTTILKFKLHVEWGWGLGHWRQGSRGQCLTAGAFTILKQEAEGQSIPTRIWKEKAMH